MYQTEMERIKKDSKIKEIYFVGEE